MLFRIGVHLGDLIEKVDGTVYGDGVNIAARLEGLADPGGIVISESVRTAVKGKIDASFLNQGEQAVKNIADPLRAFKVISGSQAVAVSRFVEGGSSKPIGVPTRSPATAVPESSGPGANRERQVSGSAIGSGRTCRRAVAALRQMPWAAPLQRLPSVMVVP